MVLKTSQKAGSFLLALVMLLSLTSVFCFKSASAATDGEWKYELENGGVTITGFIGTSRTISVPSKVNGQRVKYRSYQRRPQLQGYRDSRRIIHRVQVADYSCASLLYH